MIEPRKAANEQGNKRLCKTKKKVKDFNKQRNKSNKNQKKYGRPYKNH
jgi:hypothetical protein